MVRNLGKRLAVVGFLVSVLSASASVPATAEHMIRFQWINNVQYIINQHSIWVTVGWTDEGACRPGCVTGPIQPGQHWPFPRFTGRVQTFTCPGTQIVASNGRWRCEHVTAMN